MISEKITETELDQIKNVIWQDELCRLIQSFFREKIFTTKYDGYRITFILPNKQCIFVTGAKLVSLDRLICFKKIYITSHARQQLVRSPLCLLRWIIINQDDTDAITKWRKLYTEIENHLHNSLLFRLKKSSENALIKKISKEYHFQTIFDWIKYNNFSANVFFEQWGAEGHPSHPCNKTKLGFSDEDVINYSPEFNPKVHIFIAAANKKYVNIHSIQEFFDFLAWFNNFYPEIFQRWQNTLKEKNYPVKEYILFPVHPWQAKKILPDLLKNQLPDQALLLFEKVFILATPTLSFRTLIPITNNKSPFIKLPVAIQATSTLRTLSPRAAAIAPQMTILLSRILKDENNFDKKLFIVPEICSLAFKELTEESSKQLTVIFRENIDSINKEDDISIVVAALLQPSPVSNLPLLIEIINSIGINSCQKALEYFNNYTDILLNSYLRLYLLYGITLEGHQQNTLAGFRHGQIQCFIARDLEGADIHLETLKKTPYSSNNITSSYITNSNKDTVRNSLIHTVYQTHLGYIISILSTHYKCKEDFLWRIVAENTKKQLLHVRNKLTEKEWATEYNAFLIAEWPCKALLSMRFSDNYNRDGVFTKIANPLCGNLSN